ncbi:hypothetical protein NDU88_003826 [Pleurodeles waltl]|uniref:Uncharacterized protein n=1 Tax=Pleurodeles waltl TaxID=8319 RepID=A0AAV7UZI9_PLEWA|nr:hypothetical protein NDU88_003826 [Pleurodeles waltl]
MGQAGHGKIIKHLPVLGDKKVGQHWSKEAGGNAIHWTHSSTANSSYVKTPPSSHNLLECFPTTAAVPVACLTTPRATRSETWAQYAYPCWALFFQGLRTFGGMQNGKSSGKHSRHLLFSEAIAPPKTCPAPSPAEPPTLDATDCILQEIASVGRRLEAMDLKITDLTVASSSIRADIAGFRETANALDQHLTAVEDQVAALFDQEI